MLLTRSELGADLKNNSFRRYIWKCLKKYVQKEGGGGGLPSTKYATACHKKGGILTSHQQLWFISEHLPWPEIRTPDLPAAESKGFIHLDTALVDTMNICLSQILILSEHVGTMSVDVYLSVGLSELIFAIYFIKFSFENTFINDRKWELKL